MKDLPLAEKNEMLKENQLFCHFSRYVLTFLCIFLGKLGHIYTNKYFRVEIVQFHELEDSIIQ